MFLYYNYIPILAKHILDYPLSEYKGIVPKHNYPPFIPNNIKNNDIIFVKTDLLNNFFTNIYPNIQSKFYLLTGVGGLDVSIHFKRFLYENKIIKWIGCNIVWEHNKVFKIPIGFEENERCRGGSAEGEGGDQLLLKELYYSRKSFDLKNNKLLITYISNTHSSRSWIKEYFKDSKFVNFSNKLNFENYMKSINENKFVLCPRGSGTDTHRFWEVLLMGSVPVVEKDGLYDLYNNFPCIIVDSFKDINEDIINNFIYDKLLEKNIEKYLMLENFTNNLKEIMK